MKQISNSDDFISKFDQKDKEKIMSILHKPFQRTEGEEKLLNSFYDAGITLVPKPENQTQIQRTNWWMPKRRGNGWVGEKVKGNKRYKIPVIK